jgi:hypothetical protein
VENGRAYPLRCTLVHACRHQGRGGSGYVISNLNPEGASRDKSAVYEYNFKTRTLGKLV